jgi:hypothetical protein
MAEVLVEFFADIADPFHDASGINVDDVGFDV